MQTYSILRVRTCCSKTSGFLNFKNHRPKSQLIFDDISFFYFLKRIRITFYSVKYVDIVILNICLIYNLNIEGTDTNYQIVD